MDKLLKEACTELFIDVSEYEHPEPFEKIIQLLLVMKKGQYVRMQHRKKPLPLLQFLQEHGFDYLVSQGADIAWEIIIWNKKDKHAGLYCHAHFSA